MLSRPKPGESEEDLLNFQRRFLASGTSAAAQVIRKADKRKGTAEDGAVGRDVVTIQEFPDLPPILTPGPTKKSKFAQQRVRFADEDAEDMLEENDRHITTIFSKIIERDTSSAVITAPVPTGQAFPRVFHRSEIPSEDGAVPGKMSIFAQKMAAKRAAETAKKAPLSTGIPMDVPLPEAASSQRADNVQSPSSADVAKPLLITGEGLRSPASQDEAQRIHHENVERLKALSEEDIKQEREKLLSQLDPKLIAFLKSKKEGQAAQKETCAGEVPAAPGTNPPSASEANPPRQAPRRENQAAMSVDDLPVKTQKEWVHMDSVELEKLEWTRDLSRPRQEKTKKGMQARFNLTGDLIPPLSDVPTYMGLHHHGEEAERAGYSLQELFHLSRSQFMQQRTLSLQVLGRIVQKAKQGEFSSTLDGSVLRLLLDAGFLFLLRFSIDSTVDNVIAASVRALRTLLVSPEDEEYLDLMLWWYQGTRVFPLLPNQDDEDEDNEEEEEEDGSVKKTEEERRKSREEMKPDPDVARYDVIKGLLKTKLLHRLRYILEVLRPNASVVLDILAILTRIARHSAATCAQILDCPRLMETVVQEFLPIQWNVGVNEGDLPPSSVHGVPCSSAMKLLRVVASSGRHAAARLLNAFDVKSRLSRFVAQEPQDLPLPREEAEKLNVETFLLWAVAAGYGQACDLYRELYPVLVRILQTQLQCIASADFKTSPVFAIQRTAAIVTLLAHVTQTAGCAAELETQLSSSTAGSEPQIPPPPVSWAQVTGLLPLVVECLRGCLQEISNPATWDALQPLTTTAINFIASYYQAASRQPSLDPVACNEELENLSAQLLLPFLHHPYAQPMWDLLRSCSAVCNPLSCSPLPESVPSLVTLSCTGGKPPLSLAGKKSPFSVLTSVLNLVCSIVTVHKGLVTKFSFILDYKGLTDYLDHSCSAPTPAVTPSSNWLLRQEYHLQYFVVSLLHKVTVQCPDRCLRVPLFHSASLRLLGCLLPGSEHLAQRIISLLAFNAQFIPEGRDGGPEAADLSDILHITDEAKPTAPRSAAVIHANPSRGVLLKESFGDLPSIRACYLTHFFHLEEALGHSRVSYQERTCFIQSALLPEARGPILPSDWPFLPLINLYNKVANAETRGRVVNTLPPDLVTTVTRNLQWILLLETWRPETLQSISTSAKLARLACVFLTGGDLFLEAPVHSYTAALLAHYSQPKCLESLQLDKPPPGLASFYDFYVDLLEQFEAVSFGDSLFGTLVLLPLQRRFDVQLKKVVFGEHVSSLRSLSVSLKEFPTPLVLYTSPPEKDLDLLRLYFRTLLTGALQQTRCPVLYVVAVAHVNSFIFSQDHVTQEVDVARRSMLRKTHLLVNEGLRNHLLLYKQPNSTCPVGFDLYEQLPPIRQKYLKAVTEVPQKPKESHAS
uniref:RNA polymerase II associated protein 1 n=1 Tax=Leptobrachium leishanense TaxID=445787 RepID=A0A8C5MJR7_9ANUR